MHEDFEKQDGVWCGMHALNNYLGGPYVTRDACRRAADCVVASLSQVDAGEVEDLAEHLHLATGFLSIDVINVLGAGLLGIQVDVAATPWEMLETHVQEGALINWNNSHWTALRRKLHGTIWVHSNSVQGE